MKLSDLKNGKGIALQDFVNKKGPDYALLPKNVSKLAAVEMLMSDQPSVENYTRTRDSLATQEGRDSFISRQVAKRNEIMSSTRDSIYKDLLDPSISDEQKLEIIRGSQELPDTFTKSTNELLAQSYIQNQENPDETERNFQSRVDLIDSLRSVNRYKEDATKAINGVMASRDIDFLSGFGDIVDLAVPFAELIHVNKLLTELGGESDSVLLGNRKRDLFNILQGYTPEQKSKLIRAIINTIENNDNIVLPDGNDLVVLDTLSRMLVNNDYSDTERWIDNATTILDAIGIGSAIAGVFKTMRGGGKAAMAADALARYERELEAAKAFETASTVSPSSPSQIIREVAPDEAAGMHQMVEADTTGEAAKALYGTNRDDAIANDILPQPEVGEAVDFKPNLVRPENQEAEKVRNLRQQDGRIYLTDAEIANTNEKIISRLEDIDGFEHQPQNLVVKANEDGSTQFTTMYYPKNGGWRQAREAMSSALYALRSFGLEEGDITLFRRVGSQWVETTQKELNALSDLRETFSRRKKAIPAELKTIDYAVGIKYTHRFSSTEDVINTTFDTKWNWFDRLSNGVLTRLRQGSLTQHLLPITSVLDPHITNSAAVAVDRSVGLRKLYVDQFEPFLKTYRSLSSERRAKMLSYIQEANLKGVRLNEGQLTAQGFTPKEIEALRDWRKANDTLYYGTNADLVNTLRNRGYQVLTNGSTLRMFVRPISDKVVSSTAKIYHAGLDAVTTMGGRRENIEDFVRRGGSFARLNEPVKIDGEWVDIVAVPNNKDRGYLRAFNDNDQVLAYREGYYPVMYDANWFVKLSVKNSEGETFLKTIGSARTQDEAVKLRDSIIATEAESGNTVDVVILPDRRTNAEKFNGLSEDNFATAMSGGLSAQRFRGNRLVDAGVDYHLAGHSNLVDPLEAVATQISQLSSRIKMRNWFEAAKQRWINNYFDDLGLKPNKYGEKWFPSDPSQLVVQPGVSSKLAADARTLFNYIKSMEDGYINAVDEGVRSIVNSIADFLGSKGVTSLEVLGKDLAKASPMSTLKSAVFKLYLASNPIRQAVIQSHQTIQLIPVASNYILTGGLARDMFRVAKAARGFGGDAEAATMLKQLRDSGLLQAVDANNLVRSDMLRLADRSNLERLKRVANAPINFAQRIGFDVGEQTVLLTAWLAFRNKAIKDGVELTQRELERIAARARTYTYNMNRAGDMPYNSNTLSVVTQFLQVPHKAILQPFTDRTLSKMDRAKLLTFNTIMYGVPSGIFADYLLDMEDGPLKDSLQYGLEDVVLNGVASIATGEQQSVDFGDLAPTDLYGTSETLINLMTLDVGKLLADMPAANLFFSGNSRLTEAFRTAVRYVYTPADYEDPQLQTKLSDVVISSLSMFSGFSNYFKFRYAMEARRALNSNGKVTDDDLSRFEASLQLFGFKTKEETSRYKLNDILYQGDYRDVESDVKLWYTELKRHLARRGETVADQEAWRVLAEGWRVFGLEDQKARESLRRAIQNDLKEGDDSFIRNIQRKIDISSIDDVRKMIAIVPDKDLRRALLDDLNRYVDIVNQIKSDRGD